MIDSATLKKVAEDIAVTCDGPTQELVCELIIENAGAGINESAGDP